MKTRNTVAVSALRSALAAIDNAEAADVASAPAPVAGTIADGVWGLGAGEVDRLLLSGPEVLAILRCEVRVRLSAADDHDRLGRPDPAVKLRAEADVLATVLASSGPPGR